MRQCTRCKSVKLLDCANFYRTKASSFGFHYECKECSKKSDEIYNKKYYIRNAQSKKIKVEQKRREIRTYIENSRIGKSCEKCTNSDYRVLDYHHLKPDTKEICLGKAAKNGWSYARIDAEILKCSVLCANCHRILHSEPDRIRNASSTYVLNYKLARPCTCGMAEIHALDCHHRDPSDKLFNIGRAKLHKLEMVIIELAKCDVMCANCHRIKHYVPKF